MQRSSYFLICLCALTAAGQDASKPQLTARELFYTATPEPAAAKPAPAAPAPKKSAAPAPKNTPIAQTATPPSQPAAQHTQPTQPVQLPGGGTVIRASAQAPSTAPAPASGTPLGLKYSILRKSGDDMVEVPQDTIFHAGDRIQLSVQTNSPGYLYVISQGSSGTWQPIFPSPEVADGNNFVTGWNAATLPPNTRLLFDEQTGTEKIFIVFSRTPEESLEKMIYSLQGGKAKPASTQPQDKPQGKMKVQIADANIDNGTVGQLRDSYTRDLIIEKVDEKTPVDKSAADKKENAVYVVNPSGSADSRVVADINLVHQ